MSYTKYKHLKKRKSPPVCFKFFFLILETYEHEHDITI